jgi:hypothetical protein
MKCESCNINEIEIDLPKNEGLEGGIWDTYVPAKPYRLCFQCCYRLKNMALRPLEFFNLTAIHGHSQYLHDDFYDFDTGEATQPDIEIIDADKFPFPTFEETKNDLKKLIEYSFVQYFTDDFVFDQLRKFDKKEVLKEVDEKVRYNNSIKYKAYEIVSNVVGQIAGDWTKTQWEKRYKEEGILVYAELIANCLEFEEAFEIVRTEIEKSDDKHYNDNVSGLLYFRSEKTLDWIETQSARIKNVTSSWGQLVANSHFSWQKCEKWLRAGRPLSLVALDALYLCTTNNYTGQSISLQKIKPKLIDNATSETIASELQDYLKTDSVPRTKNAVRSITYNLFDTT